MKETVAEVLTLPKQTKKDNIIHLGKKEEEKRSQLFVISGSARAVSSLFGLLECWALLSVPHFYFILFCHKGRLFMASDEPLQIGKKNKYLERVTI